jgi:exosortase
VNRYHRGLKQVSMRNRTAGFCLWCLAVVGILWFVFDKAIRESLATTYHSHLVVVPLAVAYMIWSSRDRIFLTPSYSTRTAVRLSIAPIFVLGVACLLGSRLSPALLLLMAPIPTVVADKIISFLQAGSTELTRLIFVAIGIPVLREGFVLRIPGVSIEVARECSGINSTIALVITLLVVAYETLRTTSRRVLLLLLSIPLSIIKNAVRIVTLTLLAIYVDPSFLTGRLHHQGGFVFFLIALILMYPVWRLLQKGERREYERANQQASLARSASAP